MDGDRANVNSAAFLQNNHTSGFDLSVFGYVPEEILSASQARFPLTLHYGLPGTIGAQLSLPTTLGFRYRIESKDDLASGIWVQAGDLDGDGLTQTFTDPSAAPLSRFYRSFAC